MPSLKRKIKVAMVAPPFGDTGGPEVVVQNLTLALRRLGVAVTVFCPADWKLTGPRITTLPQSLWNMKNFDKQTDTVRRDYLVASQARVLNYQHDFDLVHLHAEKYAYAIAANLDCPRLLTLHNFIVPEDFKNLTKIGVEIITLSRTQRGRFHSFATIPNGVPVRDKKYSLRPGKFFIFFGRLAPRKGIDRAVKLAKQAGVKLLIFGRIGSSPERQKFFREKVTPYIDQEKIIYKGEVSNCEIYNYICDAKALLFPIPSPDICPMVVPEALTCGTPIIGTRVGPLPEFLGGQKKIAFLSDDDRQLIGALRQADKIFDRQACRRFAEENFDSAVMADRYRAVYRRILAK